MLSVPGLAVDLQKEPPEQAFSSIHCLSLLVTDKRQWMLSEMSEVCNWTNINQRLLIEKSHHAKISLPSQASDPIWANRLSNPDNYTDCFCR